MPINDTSILDDIKASLGIEASDTDFDTELILHINSVLGDLNQLGVGPPQGFVIESKTEKWSALLGTELRLNPAKSYMSNRLKKLFDPPQIGPVSMALKEQIEQSEWRLTVAVDTINKELAENPVTP